MGKGGPGQGTKAEINKGQGNWRLVGEDKDQKMVKAAHTKIRRYGGKGDQNERD